MENLHVVPFPTMERTTAHLADVKGDRLADFVLKKVYSSCSVDRGIIIDSPSRVTVIKDSTCFSKFSAQQKMPAQKCHHVCQELKPHIHSAVINGECPFRSESDCVPDASMQPEITTTSEKVTSSMILMEKRCDRCGRCGIEGSVQDVVGHVCVLVCL
mmetsp:Transcript_6250/g.23515  ORF Transcript_6250/g.23515 Transcript_6250/m.23515 type:complete len:158 (-) Transcript_6250:10-483(-)